MMSELNYHELAELLFSDITMTMEDYEKMYPPRQLKEGAKVTRIAPSPTGFMHLGNLFGAITDERLAHLSGGVFYLRIEDTDLKRAVEGGVETIIRVFDRFGLKFDEGATLEGDNGAYGPYRQRQREKIYKAYAKHLVNEGLAYPCFCTEETLSAMREKQEAEKLTPGYYGEFAVCRNLTMEQIKANLEAGMPYVLRLRSPGNAENRIKHTDLIKGSIEMPENDQDIVILKADGIPTYHFAHVVDDHLMRTSVVVRGEEWLATLPIHLQLFRVLGLKPPKYAHTAQLMKMDGSSKRKLSKRKDPELALDYYDEQGYCVPAVVEYLLTLLNSNFEEWRLANPTRPYNEFPFNTKKMSVSGSLFDLQKLQDVSKNVISVMKVEEVYDLVMEWAKKYDQQLYRLFAADEAKAKAILSIGRGGKKPRKDLTVWGDVKPYVSFFYDELFTVQDGYPEKMSADEVKTILTAYRDTYTQQPDNSAWFGWICEMGAKLGYAPSTKEYKANPDAFKGQPGDITMVLRVAICGRHNAPDLFEVMSVMGKEQVDARLNAAIAAL